MKNTFNIDTNCNKQQIRKSRTSIKSLVNKGFTMGLVLIRITNLLKSLVFSYTYTYICGSITRSAFSKNTKWVLLSEDNLIKDNTLSRLTSVAHLGGLFSL